MKTSLTTATVTYTYVYKVNKNIYAIRYYVETATFYVLCGSNYANIADADDFDNDDDDDYIDNDNDDDITLSNE